MADNQISFWIDTFVFMFLTLLFTIIGVGFSIVNAIKKSNSLKEKSNKQNDVIIEYFEINSVYMELIGKHILSIKKEKLEALKKDIQNIIIKDKENKEEK